MTNEQLQQMISFREQEIESYQLNIDNYTHILSTMPTEYPDRLLVYKDAPPVDLVNTLSFEDIQLLSDLQFRDRLQKTLVTEKLEQRKARLVLEALQLKVTG